MEKDKKLVKIYIPIKLQLDKKEKEKKRKKSTDELNLLYISQYVDLTCFLLWLQLSCTLLQAIFH